jgi:hypothetical protein
VSPRPKATRPDPPWNYGHPLMRPYFVVGHSADPSTPKPYLLHPDEIVAIEAMRRGRRAHPYPGTRAA